MGSPADEEGRNDDEAQHKVTLTKDFYLGKYEVTNTQYAEFLNTNGVGKGGVWSGWSDADNKGQILVFGTYRGVYYDEDCGLWKCHEGMEQYPVVNVTWFGAKAFADWVGGCLPTEAQWEYACRAGTTTAFSFWDHSGNGTVDTDLANYAWFNHEDGTQEVGKKCPNPWGLYDMYGNVIEWCLDSWNGDAYSAADAIDPVSPNPGYGYVTRGGSHSFMCKSNNCRSACRASLSPGNVLETGFRLAYVVP